MRSNFMEKLERVNQARKQAQANGQFNASAKEHEAAINDMAARHNQERPKRRSKKKTPKKTLADIYSPYFELRSVQ